MIKLFSLRQQGKEGGPRQSSLKSSAAFLRVQKGDLAIMLSDMMCNLLLSRFGRVESTKNMSDGFP